MVNIKLRNLLETALRFVFLRVFHIKVLERNWEAFIQFMKFGVVGISNTLISYISYLLFLFLGCHYLLANILSFVTSVTNSFYWNNKYVFKKRDGVKRSVVKVYVKTFFAYATTGIVLANLLLIVWVAILHVNEVLAPLINLIVTIPLNYVINKYWAYKN